MDSTDRNINDQHNRQPPSKAELLASAKTMSEAMKAPGKMDKQKVAGAASDILCAASHYGKLDEKSYGKYVEKAENYLNKYESSSKNEDPSKKKQSDGSNHDDDHGDDHSGNKYGNYIKMAEGILKKH